MLDRFCLFHLAFKFKEDKKRSHNEEFIHCCPVIANGINRGFTGEFPYQLLSRLAKAVLMIPMTMQIWKDI